MNPSIKRWWITSVFLTLALCLSFSAQAKQVGEPAGSASAGQSAEQKKKAVRKRIIGKHWKKLKGPRTQKKASRNKSKSKRRVRRTAKKVKAWPKARPKSDGPGTPKLGKVPFEAGERLLFKVRMFNGEAGEVLMAVGDTTKVGGRAAVPIVGFIRSSPFLDKIYPVRDRLVVLLDEKTHLPLKTDFYVNEKGRKSDYHTTFDHRGKRIATLRKKNGKENRRAFSPDTPLHEPLGSLYALRRMDLKAGDRFVSYIWDGRKERQVKVSVVGMERVWTPAGTFESMRIDVETRITGGYINPNEFKSPPKYGRLWLANDRYRTPVKALTPTKIGLAEAILVRRYVEKKSDVNSTLNQK